MAQCGIFARGDIFSCTRGDINCVCLKEEGIDFFRKNNLPLPPWTKIKVRGQWEWMSDIALAFGNRTDTIYGDGKPFWIRGFRDLELSTKGGKECTEPMTQLRAALEGEK